jgi:RNA polymerase sigma-70 factor (ECF subfamily)
MRLSKGVRHGVSVRTCAHDDVSQLMQSTATRSDDLESGQSFSPGFRANTTLDKPDRDPRIAQAVARAQAGDNAAIRFLYLQYKDNVYGYVLSFVRDQHEAEDVTQHVFLKLMAVIHKYQPREVPFTSWLLRVARNVALDHLRQRRMIPCEEVYELSHEVDDSGRDRRWGLEQALEALPEEQRNVVVLRHLVGLTPGEIATRMGRSEASIHGLHHRARKAMKRELAEVECAPTTRATA